MRHSSLSPLVKAMTSVLENCVVEHLPVYEGEVSDKKDPTVKQSKSHTKKPTRTCL